MESVKDKIIATYNNGIGIKNIDINTDDSMTTNVYTENGSAEDETIAPSKTMSGLYQQTNEKGYDLPPESGANFSKKNEWK